MLGKLPVPGRPTILITVGQGPTALAVGAGGGCLDIFALIYPFSSLSPSLWGTARYRLKYCLKGPLNPKQPTNQPTSLVPGRNADPSGGIFLSFIDAHDRLLYHLYIYRIGSQLIQETSFPHLYVYKVSALSTYKKHLSSIPGKDIRVFSQDQQFLSHPCYLTQDRIEITSTSSTDVGFYSRYVKK